MLNKQMEKMAEAKGYPVEKQSDKQGESSKKIQYWKYRKNINLVQERSMETIRFLFFLCVCVLELLLKMKKKCIKSCISDEKEDVAWRNGNFQIN